ncbi:non-ribosomal peptide synthetase [Nocardia nova SH22a]|uniref:Phenyloxazoline synthase MbtB n=1 Tax=Nocardia nova SH22a TaxID=1415166 RepID=W5TGP8_9NOCA|nr:non-ribosomal peptide synthetase [Nocardia nova]AHH18367.1 non-ribosomal peptide synthetase [Nocardia nova SH22a]
MVFAPDATASAEAPTEAEVRALLAEHVIDDMSEIGLDDDLIECGLNSLGMIHIASLWRSEGIDVNFAELAVEPTIRAWLRLLAERGRTARTTESALTDSDPEAPFGLATMQHAYWIGRRSEQSLGGVAAHLYAEFDGGAVDPERLRGAVGELVARHDMLRARFLESGQQIVPAEPLVPVWSVNDLREIADPDTELDRIRHIKSHQLLDVGAGQVFDVTLTLLPDNRTRLHVDVDMLAADAMSYRTLMSDLSRFYRGESAELAPIRYGYRDYLATKAETTAAEREREQQWWRDHLGDLPDPPELPLVPEAQRVDPYLTTRRNYYASPEQKAALLHWSHERGVTPAVVLAAVFSEVIGRWSSGQKFLLNLPLFNREPVHEDVALLVGDFSSSVMVSVDTTDSASFLDLAKRLQQQLHASALHSAYPGLDVIRDLGRYRGEAVLAPIVYTSGLDLGELFAERVLEDFGDPVWIVSQGPQVVLDAQVVELRGGLLVNWDVREHAFHPGVIDEMFARYSAALDRLLADAAAWDRPCDRELPAAQARRRESANFLAPPTDSEAPGLLHTRFFELARTNPGAVAVCYAGDDGEFDLSYGELAARAAKVATALRARGVRPGDVVSVQVRKGPRQIVAVLGALAAGAVYLPIGMDQPDARRAEMVRIAGVRVAVVDDPEVTEVSDGVRSVPALALDEALAHEPDEVAPHLGDDTRIAYVLFTSGSTGVPKGVAVSHRAVMNTVRRCRELFDVRAEDRSIALSALEFDLSIQDMFGLFEVGGSVVAIDEQVRRDGHRIAELIERFGVTQLYCVPGILDMILTAAQGGDALRSVRTVVVGGDRVGVDLPRRVFDSAAPEVVFAGLGGCTEASIHHTVCVVPRDIPSDWTTVPFGTPLAGVGARVVARDSGLDCPDWVPGELWIGGAGLAQGYLADPGSGGVLTIDAEKTADRFVDRDGTRWYRTGDLVRYRDDGRIEFLGRIDGQVKLRGYRIEPGEIENALRAVEGATDAVVVAEQRGGATRLVAMATTADDTDSESLAARARAVLLDRLPSYMVPEKILVRRELPLTGNGKIDHRAILAAVAAEDSARTYVAPRTSLERALGLIVGEVLDVERVGLDDDFFVIGGDSVRGTTAVARIMEGLDTTDITVGDLFVGRNVRGLAERMCERSEDPARLEVVAEIYVEVVTMSDAEFVEASAELQHPGTVDE